MTMESALRSRLRAELLRARKARDADATATLRSAVAALENAEAVPVETMPRAGAVEGTAIGAGAADAPRRVLTDEEELAVLAGEIQALADAAAQYEELVPERAASARAAAELLVRFSAGVERPEGG